MAAQPPPSRNHDEPNAGEERHSRPPSKPDWITAEMVDRTVRAWQLYYREPLTTDDAVEMLWNVGRLADLLQADGKPR